MKVVDMLRDYFEQQIVGIGRLCIKIKSIDSFLDG